MRNTQVERSNIPSCSLTPRFDQKGNNNKCRQEKKKKKKNSVHEMVVTWSFLNNGRNSRARTTKDETTGEKTKEAEVRCGDGS